MLAELVPRSLRGRLLALFIVLALAPLVVLGGVGFVRSGRAIERFIAAQTDTIVERDARAMADRVGLLESDQHLFAENTETQRLLRAANTGDAAILGRTLDSVRPYLDSLWKEDALSYDRIDLRDRKGLLILSYPAAPAGDSIGAVDPGVVLRDSVIDAARRRVGELVLSPRIGWLFPPPLHGGFGRFGATLLIDSRSAEAIGGPRGASADSTLMSAMSRAIGDGRSARGGLRLGSGGSLRVASYLPIGGTPFGLFTSASLSEFTAPDTRQRGLDLLLLGGLGAFVLGTAVILVGRTTQSLEALTRAAVAVGDGDLAPEIPEAGLDEVGILSSTFRDMTQRLRVQVREIETSRQLAVIGEFAAQLSHEIRNPLTSLQLDLQGLRRDIQRGALGADAERSVETCLREVRRLDRVARGALALGRPREVERQTCDLVPLAGQAVSAIEAELCEKGIHLEQRTEATHARVCADAESLQGAMINLLRNAAEAQPDGGGILLLIRHARNGESNGNGRVEIVVADDGPGIPPHIGERVFHPFVTSKADGTGLGLPLALRVARDHGGSLTLGPAFDSSTYRGATLCLTLPLAESALVAESSANPDIS